MSMILFNGYDLETTGLNEPEHRIIEAAILTYEADPSTWQYKKVDTWVQRINPQRSIDQKAREVHGIFESDLVGKPIWNDVAPELVRRLNGAKHCVAHNGYDFDYAFTIRELERINHALPDFEPFDTMIDGRWATPFGKAPNLGELCFASGVAYDKAEAHAAEYDVDVMMDCFFFGLRRGVFTLSTS